jgi:hypothetical protein
MKTLFSSLGTYVAAITQLLIVSVILMVASCSINPDLNIEEQKIEREQNGSAAIKGPGGSIFSFPVSFNRVDLFTVTGDNLTGTITVQIRNGDGSVVIGSTTVPASSIIKVNSKRNTFIFSPALTLSSGQKYRIYLTRSNPHNFVNDHMAWRTSSGGTDVYAKGVTNYHPGWILDYSFVTYSGGYVDQQQTITNYGFIVGNNSYLWQEFVPQHILVVQP